MTIRSNIFRCMAALTFMPVCIGCTSSLSVDNIEPNTSNEVVCFRDGTATDFQETSRVGIPVTRATSNLERSHKDFKVFGYNTVNGTDQVMMNNYKVYYVSESNKQADDNTVASDAGWSYLYDASGKAIENQGLKLWDKNASAYHFFAGSPIASTSDASLDSKTLTFSLKNTQNIAEAALYSTSQELTSSDYGKAVPLVFNYLHARVRLSFAMKEAGTSCKVSNVYLKPVSVATGGEDTYATTATCTVNYASTEVKPEYSELTPTSKELWFVNGDNEVAVSGTSKTILDDYTWYVLPHPQPISAYKWEMRVTVTLPDGVSKEMTARIPYNYMEWKAANSYLYHFVINPETGKLELGQIKVSPWTPASSVDTGYNEDGEQMKPTVDVNFWNMDKHQVYSTEFVDLQLKTGNLWSSCNLGATIPGDLGYDKTKYIDGNPHLVSAGFFAWGDTQFIPAIRELKERDGLSDDDKKLVKEKVFTAEAYNKRHPNAITEKSIWRTEYDPVCYAMGKDETLWGLPTADDWQNLIDELRATASSLTGEWKDHGSALGDVRCLRILDTKNPTSYIYLPCNEIDENGELYGVYLTSSPSDTDPDKAKYVELRYNENGRNSLKIVEYPRSRGGSVRMVIHGSDLK